MSITRSSSLSSASSHSHTSNSAPSPNSLNRNTASRTNFRDIKRKSRRANLHLTDLGSMTPRKARSITNSRLCDLCSKIRFDRIMNTSIEVLQSGRSRKDGVPIASLRTRHHQKPNNDCPLCHLLYTYVERSGPKQATYQLCAFSYLRVSKTINYAASNKKVRRADILCLMVPHTKMQDYIFCRKKSICDNPAVTPAILESKASMSICKEWLTCCRENHRACDHVGNLPKNLRVIDCHLLEIIAAPPKAAYIALSYVWGSVRPNHASEFTRTVRDAIAVAKSLGYRYLWVDKHCIDQENDDDKHDQIHQMDLVYQAADLTIIAAAGSNADAGLPGVLDTPRNQQPVVEVGDVEIINSMPHPHNTILRSRWSTRAWTLQEAVLSRRRLVFTQDQTYFECGLMNCCESLQENRQLLHTKSKDRALSYLHSGIFSGRTGDPFRSLDPKYTSMDISSLTALIEQYTARNLSYEQDSLNAFEGILRRFCRPSFSWGYGERIYHHMWGLPLDVKRFLGGIGDTKINFFWRHEQKDGSVPTRRKAFPSWSWAGWSGAVTFTNPDPLFAQLEQKIWLELNNGTRVGLEHALLTSQPSDWLELSRPRALHIKCRLVDTSEMLVKPSPRCQTFDLGHLKGTFHWSVPQNSAAELAAQFANHDYEILYIQTENAYRNIRYHPFFVVEWHLDRYTRVGVAEFSEEPPHGNERFVRLM